MIKTLEEWTNLGVGLEVYYDKIYIRGWEYKHIKDVKFRAVDIRRFEGQVYITLARVDNG